jgi:hypothetical protein
MTTDALEELNEMVRCKDLEAFLDHMSETCRKGVAEELLCVAAGVWKELGTLNFKICERRYLLRAAERWALSNRRHYFHRAGFMHINLRIHLISKSDPLLSNFSP